MPTKIRPRPEGPKDITANSTTPLTGNSANLVIAKIDDEVDTTNVYTYVVSTLLSILAITKFALFPVRGVVSFAVVSWVLWGMVLLL